MREGGDAMGSRAELDWFNALTSCARGIRAVPLVRQDRGALDLVSVRSCCEGFLRHVFGSDGAAGKGVSYVHEVEEQVVPFH